MPYCKSLSRVQLHYNNLSGPIPNYLGNLFFVRSLSMLINSFKGSMSEALGRLKTLIFLGFGLNRLLGKITKSFYNLSTLLVPTLPYNQLHGNWPTNLGFTLSNMQVLNIGHNMFTRPLPKSLSNVEISLGKLKLIVEAYLACDG